MPRVHEISAEVTKIKTDSLVKLLTEKYGDGQGCAANETVFLIEEGTKFYKIVRQYVNGSGRSVYAFIDKETGNIFKAASWRAPAKHARGNVHNVDNGFTCCNQYSVAYLR